MAARQINNQAFARDGLLHIDYFSNVLNHAEDIRRQQRNQLLKARIRPPNTVNAGDELATTTLEPYRVTNSDANFNVNEKIPLNIVLQLLTIPLLQNILRHYRRPVPPRQNKRAYVELVNQTIRISPRDRERYVRQVLADHIDAQRVVSQGRNREHNRGMLVSNRYKYEKKHFKDMSLKDILRSLFDDNYHLIFLRNRVLKERNITPMSRETVIELMNNRIANQGLRGDALEEVFEQENRKANEILKNNVMLIVSLLFQQKRPFFVEPINKKPYTIAAFTITDAPNPDPGRYVVTPNQGVFAIYDLEIRLELVEESPDKVTSKQLRSVGCHLQKEKIRKNWFEITGNQTENVFEPKYHKTITRKDMMGGRKLNKKTKKRRK